MTKVGINELIARLRPARPLNVIWGAGSSGLHRASITFPRDPEVREAVKKYDNGDWVLSQIKRKFYLKTMGLEDVHSCLLALNDVERKEVLTWVTNWANVCLAELIRAGRVGRVFTTNFDGHLVCATATLRLLPPLYRGSYPALQDAVVPSIYLMGDAPPATSAGLLSRGAATGPWLAVGVSGKHPGLVEALLSVSRFEDGLFWAGHFDQAPPPELAPIFTAERGACWISGFDADSLMMYLLRGLAEFPPVSLSQSPKATREAWLRSFAEQRHRDRNYQSVMEELNLVLRSGEGLRKVMDDLLRDFELAARSGHSTILVGTRR